MKQYVPPRGVAHPARRGGAVAAWPARHVGLLKGAVFVAAAIPAIRLVHAGLSDGLGANPIEFITRFTGDWALIFLCITLSVSPLRWLTQWHWVVRFRRMLGLFTFFYALVHVSTYFWLDKQFDFHEIFDDVWKRPYITAGFTAFVLLVPLAVTSTNAMVRWLGAARWRTLHRSVYAIACLAILHFWWMKAGKHDFEKPFIYGAIVALLLGVRVARALRARRRPPGPATA